MHKGYTNLLLADGRSQRIKVAGTLGSVVMLDPATPEPMWRPYKNVATTRF
jgi:prepilin-type processing-associated H-X9-DG protein